MTNTVNISRALVALSNKASTAANGFFVLGELDGLHAFEQTLAKELKSRGWPISDAAHNGILDDMREFMDQSFTHNHTYVTTFGTKDNIKTWLEHHSEAATAAFVTDPKNLTSLSQSIDAAIAAVQKTYGDPMTVKYLQRSYVKAAISTVVSKVTPKTPETKLTLAFRNVAAAARDYSRKHGVPHMEFFGRVADELSKKGWQMTTKGGYGTDLGNEFSSIAQTSYFAKTQMSIRHRLQDDNVPARKPYRAAKDFMQEHTADINAAVTTVAKALDKEVARLGSFDTYHVIMKGHVYKGERGPKASPA